MAARGANCWEMQQHMSSSAAQSHQRLGSLSWICAPCLQAGAEPCEPGGPRSAGAAEQERGVRAVWLACVSRAGFYGKSP